MWTAAGPNPHLVSRLGLASQPSGGLGDSPRPGRTACQVWKGLSVRQPPPNPCSPLSLPKSWWKMWVTESSQRHWKKARPAGVMASWCFL